MVVNMMIPKEDNNWKIHRLQVIHLYEADCNLILGVKWRDGLHYLVDNRLLNESMYGSRPGRSTHEPIMLEVLQTKVYHTSRKKGIHQDNDASSYYDWILASVASLASQKYGISIQVALVNSATLKKAKFKLKTALSISTHHYSHSATHLIHGTGQGSGNSPMNWCFLSSALFDANDEKAHGATFGSYDKKHPSLYLLSALLTIAINALVNSVNIHSQ